MAFRAVDIFRRAAVVLQDDTHVRWTLAELCDWLNDGTREIVLHKPNASSDTSIVSLQAGTYQTIPSGSLALLRVIRNLKTTTTSPRVGGRMIQVVNREILDSQRPYWHDTTITPSAKEVKHATFDTADPQSFYVFPPNDGTGIVEVVVSTVPTTIPYASPDPEDISGYAVNVDLPEIYQNVLLSYVLYRAYTKDAQFAGNSARAGAYYQEFANALQLKVSVEAITNPNITTRADAPHGVAP